MLNRQEQYWLDCWRRSQPGLPEATARRRRYRLGSITHGLYAARILNAEERVMVAEWQEVVAGMREQFPEEGDRIDLLVIYWLFLFRAIQADHVKAIQRAGRAVRTHLKKLTHSLPAQAARQASSWEPEEEQLWQYRLLAEHKKRKNIAENAGEIPNAHA